MADRDKKSTSFNMPLLAVAPMMDGRYYNSISKAHGHYRQQTPIVRAVTTDGYEQPGKSLKNFRFVRVAAEHFVFRDVFQKELKSNDIHVGEAVG